MCKSTLYRLSALLLLPLAALAQESASTSLPLLDILAMGGWIRYPIYLLLLVGVALAVQRFLTVRGDRARSAGTFQMNVRGRTPDELKKELGRQPESELSRAAGDMLVQFANTRNYESLGTNIERFMMVRQDWFKPFVHWMMFLSDSAGALGLLGTVLGMFQTFFGGTLDKDKILHGMGVALITTLLGIIVSLIINLLLTLVRNHFDGELDRQYQKLVEIRQAMLNQLEA